MEVYFWGSRGSIPASFSVHHYREKLIEATKYVRDKDISTDDKIREQVESMPFEIGGTYGTNTSCVEIRASENAYVLCDCGSGLRDFANHVISKHDTQPQEFHIFMSHFHWDHIMGFPFFIPAFIPGNQIHIYGCHEDIEHPFRRQQEQPSFPVPIDIMGADIQFHRIEPEQYHEVAGMKVWPKKLYHPGDAYGYRFEKDGQLAVYASDCEHPPESNEPDYPFLEYFRNADIVIYDAQYDMFEHIDTKAHWGHSSNVTGVDLAVRSGVKRLCLFHNEHTASDDTLEQFKQSTENYLSVYDEESPLKVMIAYDGLSVDCASHP